MKKIIILLFLLLTPSLASATLDQNLYYGLLRNDSVKELQRYLIDKGFMTGQATGNFYTVTLVAVKNYQASKSINKTGYVGPLTRQAINADLSNTTQTPTQTPSIPTNLGPLTGSLNLLQNTAYSNQTATIPQTKFKLADFSLTNNTTESINLNKIQIDLAIDSSLYISNLYIRNLYVVYGSNKTTILDTVAHNNYWSINYQLPIGQTINLSVYGDVNSSIPLNSVVNCSALVTGATTVTAATVNSNSNVVSAGQGITFGSGSLAAAQDSSTPSAKIVTINQRIVAGKFKFTSTGDSYTISELKFMIPNSRAISAISAAVLTDSADQTLSITKPALVAYSDNKYVVDFNVSIPISSNSTKSLTLYYDLGPNIYYSTVANASIAPILVYVKARNSREVLMDGVANDYTNSIVASYDDIALPNDGVKVNDVYVFKSTPIFTVSSSSTTALNNSEINLYTFNVSADKNGDISMKQIMFAVTINDPSAITFPHLNNFKLFKGDKDYTSSVIIGNNVNNNYVGLTGETGIGVGTNTVIVTFNREETILAGKNETYTLKAYADNFTTHLTLGSMSVSTYIPADTEVSSNGSYLRMLFTNIYGLSRTANDFSVVNYNLLWSDKSALSFFPHSDLNGYSTSDWYNGFGILSTQLSTQTVTAK